MHSTLETQIVVRPNASASRESVLKLLVCIGGLTFVIAYAFLRMGAWLVLPFAGLEFVLVVLAFVLVMRHSGDYEMISVGENHVEVERCELGRVSRLEFQRYWTRVTLRNGEDGKTSLMIGSHNKEVEFGRLMMNDAQRAEMVKRIKQALITK